MRVLVVNVHYAPESFGGATIVAERTAAQLAAAGHDVAILTGSTHIAPGSLYRYDADGLPVLALGRRVPLDPDEGYHQPDLAASFQMVLDTVQPDVVHFHAMQSLGVEMVRTAQSMGVATVVTLHDAWWLCERQFMVRADGRWCAQTVIDEKVCATCVPDAAAHRTRQTESLELLNACDLVLTPSRYWHDLMGGSGVAGDVLAVNRNGVVHPQPGFHRSEYRGPIRFGYVGGDNPIKGAPQLRAALAGMTRSDYVLQLVDSSQLLGHQSLFVHDWQYSGQIEVIPGYEYNRMDEFFDSIDVLLFPSQWRESYGLTVREALLRGVWVVATEGGGVSEDLVDGVNATLIPMDGRHRDLREAIVQILDDPGSYRDRAAPVNPIPTFADQAVELQGLYERALNSRRV